MPSMKPLMMQKQDTAARLRLIINACIYGFICYSYSYSIFNNVLQWLNRCWGCQHLPDGNQTCPVMVNSRPDFRLTQTGELPAGVKE